MASLTPPIIDPKDPRAPSTEVWNALTDEEREQVLDMLPAEVPLELHPPEGDDHYEGKNEPLQTLRRFFKGRNRKIYLSCDLAVYYPNEAMFCPDLLAVLDVDDHHRNKWVVNHEGKGLDFVLEVHVADDRKKDFEQNVERYARLGIPEYFAFDPPRKLLRGYRLAEADAGVYQPILAQAGRYESLMLDLHLCVEGDRLRFYYSSAPIPETDELVDRLQSMVDGLVLRSEEIEQRADQLEHQLDEERQRADQLEKELEAFRKHKG